MLRCSKRYAHDWRACPFGHPTENARRRDPREFKYCSIACPDYKQGFCLRGDTCQYAHGVFECWLHPSRYRTQLCKDGSGCRRPVCFFAHSLAELRTPTHAFVPKPEERLRVVPAHMMAVGSFAMPTDSYASEGAFPADQNPAFVGSSSSAKPLLDLGPNAAPDVAVRLAGGMMGGLHPDQQPDSPTKQLLGSSSAMQQQQQQQQQFAPSMTAPRMSNAFARRHGLNPKDHPIVNLQRMAMQQQQQQVQSTGVSCLV